MLQGDDDSDYKCSDLRREAEGALRPKSQDVPDVSAFSPEEVQRLVHELGVRQIELEMQNEELRRAQQELGVLRDKYSEFYEFAPLGFFTLDQNGVILEANRTCAELLGMDRSLLIGKPFFLLVCNEDRDTFHFHLKELREADINRDCDIKLIKKDGGQFYAHLRSVAVKDCDGRFTEFRIAVSDITKQKRAEEFLIRANQEWELTFNTVPDLVMVLDAQHRIIRANKAMAAAFGMRKEALVGRHCFEVVHGGNEPPRFCPHAKLLGDENQHSVEIFEPRLGGTYEIRVAPLADQGGHLLGSVHIVRDITARKQMEQELRDSEERYRAVFDNAGIGINVLDPSGKIEQANPALLNMLGHTEKDLRQLTVMDIIHPDDREIFRQGLEAIAGGEVASCRVEIRHVKKDGSLMWTDLSASTIRDAEGKPRAAVGLIADITEQKKSQIALKESEEKLRLIIDSSPIGISIVQNGKYVYVNPTFAQMFGYETGDEVIGLPKETLYASESKKLVLMKFADGTGGGEPVSHYEAVGLTKTEKRIDVGAWVTQIDYSGKRAFLAFVMDFTESKGLRSQLLQSQKMEAIGTLSGGIAHDFNNILTVVLGFSELLLAGREEGSPDYADLQKVIQAAGKGADLIQRLLAFSRKAESNPRPINLNHQVEQIKDMLTRAIPKMTEIELILADSLSTTNADPTQIDQVLMNLAVNARDAMPDGGKLTIETKNVALDEEYCRGHVGAKPGDYVLLSVSDTGCGMDEETLQRIFEPFFTTKTVGKGTGLGLAMVYGIVKQHGGYVTCDSEPGSGSTFKIYLPVVQIEAELGSPAEKLMIPRGMATILLADDEEPIVELGKRILERSGYTVLIAANGKDALSLYEKGRDTISLVILDLIMPGMGGKKCFQELLKINPQVKVIIASGYTSAGTLKDATELGARGFVRKPFDIGPTLLRTVREVLDQP